MTLNSTHSSIGPILGQGYSRRVWNSIGSLSRSSSFGQHSTHKIPRPIKTNAALASLVKGLKSLKKEKENEVEEVDGLKGKTSKTLSRHLRHLEFHLTLIEELSEEYSVQVKLREGVRTMAYAYAQGKNEMALANVKAGFRECTEQLCRLESQLENLMGAFDIRMGGIQGFARLCPGDIYEITLKHSHQKWKTRGYINKNNEQSWDVPSTHFRAVLGELIHIKAAEVKTLGKHTLVGNKYCEINELFSPMGQLMTVNLNPSGSLKLNLVVEWSPLDSLHSDYPTLSKKPRLSPGVLADPSQRHSILWERSLGCIQYFTPGCDDNFTMREKGVEEVQEERTLQELIAKLMATLEDVQGQYPELEELQNNLQRVEERISPQQLSTSTLSIQSALECFDFLDEADDVFEFSKREKKKSSGILDPRTTTRTTDSGISSRTPSPPLAAKEELEPILETHVRICLQLANHLAPFGPLKSREKSSVTKLQVQGKIVGRILGYFGSDVNGLKVLNGSGLEPIWITLTTNGMPLSIDTLTAKVEIEKMMSASAAGEVVKRITDSDVITVFQFGEYWDQLVKSVLEEDLTIPTTLPPNCPPHLLTHLVTTNSPLLSSVNRSVLIAHCIEMLEYDSVQDRSTACTLLGNLNAVEAIQELVFVSQSDASEVAREAKESLIKLKSSHLIEQLDLYRNGFIGK